MSKFRETNRREEFLLPPSVEDFIPAGHLARLVDEVVSKLDLDPIEQKYSYLGRKGYAPSVLVKIIFYGYAIGERSSRVLARRCETDLAYMFLAEMERPDFRTISDFRKNNLAELKALFRDIVVLCQKMGLGCGGRLFIDGSKILANAAAKRTKDEKKLNEYRVELQKAIDDAFAEAERVDEEEDREYGDRRGDELPEELRKKADRLRKIDEAIRRLKEEGEKSINLTDPDAKKMKTRGGIRPGYKAQAVVTGDGVIVAQDVVCEANDLNQLKPMTELAETVLTEPLSKVIADGGYGTYDNLGYLKERGIDGYLHDFYGDIHAFLTGSKEDKEFHRFNFAYDEKADEYICPRCKRLKFRKTRKRGNQTILYYEGTECETCPVRPLCTKGEVRTLSLDTRTPLVLEMLEKLRTPEGEAIYKKRMSTIEPVFGNTKFNLGFDRFLLRGHEKVKGEYSLMSIGHNIGKMYQKVKEDVKKTGQSVREFFKGLAEEAAKAIMENGKASFNTIYVC